MLEVDIVEIMNKLVLAAEGIDAKVTSVNLYDRRPDGVSWAVFYKNKPNYNCWAGLLTSSGVLRYYHYKEGLWVEVTN